MVLHRPVHVPALVLLCLSLTACNSIRSPGIPSNPWAGSGQACGEAKDCSRSDAIAAMTKSLSYCMDLRGYYERGGEVTGSQRLFVGVLGSLAGSVFAVLGGGTASKAWAGLSGATNGIQTQLDQGGRKPAPEVIERIAQAQEEFATAVGKLVADGKWNQVVALAVVLPGRCDAAQGRGLAAQHANAEAAQQSADKAVKAADAAQQAASAAQKAAAAPPGAK